MKNTALRHFNKLNSDEQAYALEMVRKRPHWNMWLNRKIRKKLSEELAKSGIQKDILRIVSFDRYSYIEGCYFGGEVPIRLKVDVCSTLEAEMNDLIKMVYGTDEETISKIHPEHISSIYISIYGDTALAEVGCVDEEKAFPSDELSREQFENTMEVFFSAFSSAIEVVLTLYSRKLRMDENIMEYMEKCNVRFDDRLRVVFESCTPRL